MRAYSVHSDETISAVLRELGFNAINLGNGNNGPLLEFATLKEYGEPLRSKVVLWLYCYNDLKDLNSEMIRSILYRLRFASPSLSAFMVSKRQ